MRPDEAVPVLEESQREALEADVRSLPGVRACRVAWTPAGRIAELHVVSGEDKSAKQIVRDIQTLALAGYGLHLDYRVVSVVRVGPAEAKATRPRAVLSSVSWSVEGGRTTCRVDLVLGDGRATGEARGASTAHGRLRLAAQAAADALHGLNGRGPALDVADVMMTEAAGRRLAVVVLVMLSDRSEEFLAGTAVVRSDDADAIARAVLDAVNRRLTM